MRMITDLLRERPMRMAWEVRREGLKGFLVGTAHFFPYRFRRSFLALMEEIDRVLIEGPLDETDMETVRVQGVGSGGEPPLAAFLERGAVERLNRELAVSSLGGGDTFSSFTEHLRTGPGDLFGTATEGLRPWMAFFKIWSFFLLKRGWTESVDREVLTLAKARGRQVSFLETIEEQIRALEGIPHERIIRFLNMVHHWERFARRHARSYLKGDLAGLLSVTEAFPTRCDSIVGSRDPVLFGRALPYLEGGRAMVCVGTIHLKGLMGFLEAEGYHCVPWRA